MLAGLRRLQQTWRENPGAWAFAAAAWIVGAALRLSFPGDIEFKGDEAWTFHTAMAVLKDGNWPAAGMGSSVGLPNPGLSVWLFPLLARVTGATTPVGLARAVQAMNCLALAAVFLFALGRGLDERRVWLWTAALACVDPLGIILQRKIWAQSALPIFAWTLFLAWRIRDRPAGALAWGLMGVLIGQLHMSGFFYAAVLAGWSAFAAVRARGRQPVRWIWWLAGTVVGSLPMLPWLDVLRGYRHLATGGPPPPAYMAGNAWRLWIEDTLGWNLTYSLGPVHLDLLKGWPLSAGHPTGLVAASLVAAAGAGAALLAALAYRCLTEPRQVLVRLGWDGAVAHNVGFVGYGLLMNLLPVAFFRHYLLVAFPFTSMTLPLVAFAGRVPMRLLAIVWAAHALIAVCLLLYLHANHGAPGGDYGVALQFQPRHG